jgi:hypothetical protein
MNLSKTIHYCKAKKKTGKPVIITDCLTGDTMNVKKWKIDLFDKNGVPVRLEVEFNNSSAKAKKQGATTVLKIFT